MRGLSNYARLVIAVKLAALAAFTIYFVLILAPDLTLLSRQDPYLACTQLMDVLDLAQWLLLLLFVALAVVHLGYGVQKTLSDAPLPLEFVFLPKNFSLAREVLFDVYVLIVVAMVAGMIEGVQALFACESLAGT